MALVTTGETIIEADVSEWALPLCAILLFFNNGFMWSGVSAFDPVLMKSLSFTVAQLKLGDTLTIATMAIAFPVSGYLIDRIGLRGILCAGTGCMSVGLVLYSQIWSYTSFLLCHFLFGLCLVLSGTLPCAIVASRTRPRWRAMKVGTIAASGSLGMAVAPLVLTTLASVTSWRVSVLSVAVLTGLLLPIVLHVMPRGRKTWASRQATVTNPYRTIVLHRSFMAIAVVAAVGYLAGVGLIMNTVLYLREQCGLPIMQTSLLILVSNLAGLATQVLAGFVADRFNQGVWHVLFIAAMAVAFLLSASGIRVVEAAVVPIAAIAWGGHYVLLQYLLTRIFAGPYVGRAIGLIGAIEAAGGAAGPIFVGFSYSRFQSYTPGLVIASGLLAVTLALAVMLYRGYQGYTPASQRLAPTNR